MSLVGLDVGTTGCKAVVFDPEGNILGYGFQGYGIICDEPGMAEQNAELVWQLTCQVLKKALTESAVKSVSALSLSVQGDAIIPVDKKWNAVYPAVLGMDYRSTAEAQKCEELFGARALFDLTGMRSHPIALNHIGGLLLQWYRDNLAGIEVQEAKQQERDVYDHILSKVPEGPSQIMVLPHFNGSGTPWCDMSSKGAIVGLTLSSTRHEIARAILESQTYELKINIETLEQAGVKIEELVAVGGGAKSLLWLQIKANILGRPVKTLKVREAACLGAAILAGAASGVYRSVDEGVSQTVQAEETFAPDQALSEQYTQQFLAYKELYPALIPVYKRL